MGELEKIAKSRDIQEFLTNLGEKITPEEIQNARKMLKIKTIHGELNGEVYDLNIKALLWKYMRYGTAREIYKMMKKQNPSVAESEILFMLLHLAKYELEYGLEPINHVIPVNGKPYVTATGYLYYAKKSGRLKGLKFETVKIANKDYVRCVAIVDGENEYVGEAPIMPPVSKMDDPLEKAKTKAMRRALRRAFPIGAGEEPLGFIETELDKEEEKEFENLIENLSELTEGDKDEKNN